MPVHTCCSFFQNSVEWLFKSCIQSPIETRFLLFFLHYESEYLFPSSRPYSVLPLLHPVPPCHEISLCLAALLCHSPVFVLFSDRSLSEFRLAFSLPAVHRYSAAFVALKHFHYCESTQSCSVFSDTIFLERFSSIQLSPHMFWLPKAEIRRFIYCSFTSQPTYAHIHVRILGCEGSGMSRIEG